MSPLIQIDVKKFIDSLKHTTSDSKAVKNDFYDLWIKRPLTLAEAEIVLANFFARTINTAGVVCDVIRALIDPIRIIKDPIYAKAIINNLENLHDELGNGIDKKPHPLLMAEWINKLLEKLGSKNIPIEDNYHKFITDETKDFCRMQKALYTNPSLYTVLAASFAQETIADYMMKQLHEGYVKNYRDLFINQEEFDSTNVYFTAHVNGTEEHHGELIYDLITLVCKNQADLQQVRETYEQFEQITINFWHGIFKNINTIA